MQTYAPFGLRPAYSMSGIIRPAATAKISSAYGTAIYQGNPVALGASLAANGFLTAVAAGDDNLWNGAFSGVEYTDTTGRRVYLNRWIAGTPLPVNADLVAYYTADDVGLVYEIQCNAALPTNDPWELIGEQFNFTTIAGNDLTGLAATGLDVSSAAGSGDQGQLRLIGLRSGPDNAWDDPYPVVLVQNAAHPWVARVNVNA